MLKILSFSIVLIIIVILGVGVQRASVEPLDIKPNPPTFANGFTNLYANLRYYVGARAKSKYVIDISDTKSELIETLERLKTKPAFKPTKELKHSKRRQFREGETIMSELKQFALDERVHLVWTLPKDYIIKGDFEVQGSFVSLASNIARVIDPDFAGEVKGWYCHLSNAIVITDAERVDLPRDCKTQRNKRQ